MSVHCSNQGKDCHLKVVKRNESFRIDGETRYTEVFLLLKIPAPAEKCPPSKHQSETDRPSVVWLVGRHCVLEYFFDGRMLDGRRDDVPAPVPVLKGIPLGRCGGSCQTGPRRNHRGRRKHAVP